MFHSLKYRISYYGRPHPEKVSSYSILTAGANILVSFVFAGSMFIQKHPRHYNENSSCLHLLILTQDIFNKLFKFAIQNG
jgi:hypothetical protein